MLWRHGRGKMAMVSAATGGVRTRERVLRVVVATAKLNW
jgi:hypothetical protein